MIEVFSSGGGTQSACIAALIVQGRLPKPDFAVIVDTERERQAVWDYHDAVIVPELAKVGVTMHRVRKSDFATTDLWSTNGEHLQIPAFTDKSGAAGKLSNFCSDEWKKRVLDRWLRTKGVKKSESRKWIGFSLDEASRYTRMALSEDGIKGLIRWPLIHDVPFRRRDAIRFVEECGWPTPPRSACWMCPNQGDHEWRDLKENWPKEFQLAISRHPRRAQDSDAADRDERPIDNRHSMG